MQNHHFFPRFDYYQNKKLHIGICGSIAAYKILDLMRRFQDSGILVSATLTDAAQKFVSALSFEALGANPVYTTMFAKKSLLGLQSSFAHLEPGQVADAMLIAPASASTLSRLAVGSAEELLACQALAFDGPILLAPAMNTKMWVNPATQANVETLQDRGYFLTEPISGVLACEELGTGKLANLSQIYLETLKLLTEQDLFGKKILITLGPTKEKWDAVRVWTNNSTGNMGMGFAYSAWLRGAEVHVVAGPVSQFMPVDESFFSYNVESADEMFDICDDLWDDIDIGIFTAAVADFKPLSLAHSPVSSTEKLVLDDKNTLLEDFQLHLPEQSDKSDFSEEKFKKENYKSGFSINFAPNKDILKTLASRKAVHQKIIGFAAESKSSMTELALTVQKKMKAKNCDIMVGNFLDDAMGSETNSVLIANFLGKTETKQNMPKNSLAWEILTELMSLPYADEAHNNPVHAQAINTLGFEHKNDDESQIHKNGKNNFDKISLNLTGDTEIYNDGKL